MNNLSELGSDYGLEVERVLPTESLFRTIRRRLSGRYPVDAFGLDPQLADLSAPIVRAIVHVNVTGAEHVPSTGGAVLVVNRGFGIFEPAAVAVAVQRATGRRTRVIGAPTAPIVSGLSRRLGAISASGRDLSTCVRAGHLVAVPLAPTWLRTGAGTPPLPLMQAMTRAPAIPVAVSPGGPLGTAIRPWRVRFGHAVTLDQNHDPGDPLGAARLAEAVRDAVSQLLVEP